MLLSVCLRREHITQVAICSECVSSSNLVCCLAQFNKSSLIEKRSLKTFLHLNEPGQVKHPGHRHTFTGHCQTSIGSSRLSGVDRLPGPLSDIQGHTICRLSGIMTAVLADFQSNTGLPRVIHRIPEAGVDFRGDWKTSSQSLADFQGSS